MEDFISRNEHEEFCRRIEVENKRMEDENGRQNHRIGILEESVRQFTSLASSVDKLATNMENMLKEQERQGKRLEMLEGCDSDIKLATNMENMLKIQEKQGERLEALEGRDGEMWRKVTGYIATVIIGIVVGYIFTRIGM